MTTSSTVRGEPSTSVTRPVRAARAASAPVSSEGCAIDSARSDANDEASATRSSAPRTEAPSRRSGWLRVARTASTARRANASSGPSGPSPPRATMASSSVALWWEKATRQERS